MLSRQPKTFRYRLSVTLVPADVIKHSSEKMEVEGFSSTSPMPSAMATGDVSTARLKLSSPSSCQRAKDISKWMTRGEMLHKKK